MSLIIPREMSGVGAYHRPDPVFVRNKNGMNAKRLQDQRSSGLETPSTSCLDGHHPDEPDGLFDLCRTTRGWGGETRQFALSRSTDP